MTTEQQQSDRDFERQALYNQYVAYSKAAARMLWILLAFTVYLGYALIDRRVQFSNAVRAYERATLEWHFDRNGIGDLPYCPTLEEPASGFEAGGTPWFCAEWEQGSSDGPGSSLPQFDAKFDKEYKLPLFGFRIHGVLLLLLGPLALAITSIVYWSYLRGARLLLGRYLEQCASGGRLRHRTHPWAYNLPLGPAGFRAIWQVAIELVPTLIVAAAVFGSSACLGRIWLGVVFGLSALLGFLAIHSRMFGVPMGTEFQDMDWQQRYYALAVYAIVWTAFNSWDSSCTSEGFEIVGVLFATFLVALVIDYAFINGHYLILPFLALFAPVQIVVQLFTRRDVAEVRATCKRILVRLKQGPKFSGYVVYCRQRYRDLKDLNSDNGPPPNPQDLPH